jgi:quercetin dioxygenase-like cupin family protein
MPGESSAKKAFILGHEVTPIIVGGRIAAVDVTVTPHVPGPPPHHHIDSDEFFYMLDGALEIMSGGEWHSVATGDYFVVPGNTVHSFRVPGDRPARFLTGWEPQGFEHFFVECGIDAHDTGAFERSTADAMLPKILESFVRNGAIPAEAVTSA